LVALDRERYDNRRSFEGKAFRSLCYAPFSSLFFHQSGKVRACCHNWQGPLGDIRHNTIDEIWSGAQATALRQALKNYQFGNGCEFCEFQSDDGVYENLAINRFEHCTVSTDPPEWPQQMEFALSNVCNLECIMCRGEWSSLVRARREKLPAIPKVYSDEIVRSFRKYLPHLKGAKFLGGEPFLITEYHQIWDMMTEDDLHIPCHVTTNGTQYNARVERILEQIPMSFAVSMDGVTRETVESIRVNAKYDEVVQNAKRFRDYAKRRGTYFGLTYCLMRQNWHEFADYCLLADEWDCEVYVNTVIGPENYGVYRMSYDELAKVLAHMEARAPELEGRLKRNKRVWFGELERIRAKVREGCLPESALN
jgi:MoaA/NifB/PqqE/SkfB family radical SAM enzyme